MVGEKNYLPSRNKDTKWISNFNHNDAENEQRY